jgi:hypothetical protein
MEEGLHMLLKVGRHVITEITKVFIATLHQFKTY